MSSPIEIAKRLTEHEWDNVAWTEFNLVARALLDLHVVANAGRMALDELRASVPEGVWPRAPKYYDDLSDELRAALARIKGEA